MKLNPDKALKIKECMDKLKSLQDERAQEHRKGRHPDYRIPGEIAACMLAVGTIAADESQAIDYRIESNKQSNENIIELKKLLDDLQFEMDIATNVDLIKAPQPKVDWLPPQPPGYPAVLPSH